MGEKPEVSHHFPNGSVTEILEEYPFVVASYSRKKNLSFSNIANGFINIRKNYFLYMVMFR